MRTKVALVGVGRWGKNLLRVFAERCQVTACCNKDDPAVHEWLKEEYPSIRGTFDYGEILGDANIGAVIIATPIDTHAKLARQALEAGKHVFVEKPLATSVQDTRFLVDCATKKGLILFVGYLFLYHPALELIRALTKEDPIVYAKMVWTKFGTFGEDILWNLVSHEISIALELFQAAPDTAAILHKKGIVTVGDTVVVHLGFGAGRECILDVNRCANTKVKSVTIVTESGKAFLWENASVYKIVGGSTAQLLCVKRQEPLALEADAFMHSLQTREPASSDGAFSLRVVEVMEQLRITE